MNCCRCGMVVTGILKKHTINLYGEICYLCRPCYKKAKIELGDDL